MQNELLQELALATWQTIYMVLISGFIASLFGIPMGVILLTTRRQGLLEHITVNRLLAALVNALRSVPFIILLVAIIPFTRLLVGTSIGTTAAIVPLSVAAIPFVARLVENRLSEVPYGLIEAGLAMGATPAQIIFKILLPEAAPGIMNGITITMVTLIGYSAMAGAVGGGGLGDLAIRYGYQRFDVAVMIYTVVILMVLVQLMQLLGDKISKHYNKT